MYMSKKSNEQSSFPVFFNEIPTTCHFYQTYSWDLYLELSEINHKNTGY